VGWKYDVADDRVLRPVMAASFIRLKPSNVIPSRRSVPTRTCFSSLASRRFCASYVWLYNRRGQRAEADREVERGRARERALRARRSGPAS